MLGARRQSGMGPITGSLDAGAHTPIRPIEHISSFPKLHRALCWVVRVVMPPALPSWEDNLSAEETHESAGGSLVASDWRPATVEEDSDESPVSHVVVENESGLWGPFSSSSRSDVGSGTEERRSRKPNDGDGGDAGVDVEMGRISHNSAEWDLKRDSPVGGGDPARGSTWRAGNRLHHILFTNLLGGIISFFNPRFPNPAEERKYQEEAWYGFRQGAVPFSSFFTIAWILTVSLMSKPIQPFNKIAYVIVNGVLSAPLPFLVAFDLPRRAPLIYKAWLLAASFEFASSVVINMYTCGFYGPEPDCPNAPSYIALFYWAIGLPVIAILGLGQSRFFHLCGVVFFDVLTIGMVLVEPGAPALMIRNLVNYSLFNVFLLMASFLREQRDRKLFSLRLQLKSQFRATQSAQVAERRATVAHKRFAAYIYHEVRVPLNTATLAVQNLEGERAFDTFQGDQRDMVEGLRGSLDLMAKVLSDSLSFERMESGKLLLARVPFELRKAIDLVVLSHRAQAESVGLVLSAEMDPEIDGIDGEGVFIGDPLRLTQVMGNLVSNACKFTPAGSVRIVAKLLHPRPIVNSITPDERSLKFSMESVDLFPMATLPMTPAPNTPARESYPQYKPATSNIEPRTAIVRFEVHDTGVGLRRIDVAENNLFSPYKQTEIGRRQGNKGSGLGLALCMQIVSLMRGRMGVESQIHQGSCFWFEIPLTMPKAGTGMEGAIPSDFMTQKTPSPTQGDGTPRVTPHRSPTQTQRTPILATCGPGARQTTGSPASDQSARMRPSKYIDNGIVSPSSLLPYPPEDVSRSAGLMDKLAAPIHLEDSSDRLQGEDKGRGAPLQALVVDDDKLTRMLMTRMVKRLGHVVTTAENGALATDFIRTRNCSGGDVLPPFDVMFLDNHMPVMTGVDASRAIRAMGCRVFLVGCTGNALREDQEEYLDAGADQVLTKPVREADVREMLNEAMIRRDQVVIGS